MSSDRGLLFIVSAPSGTGKTTLVERLVEHTPSLKMSRSYTSRPARDGETDGVDYNFVRRPTFEAMAAAGEFLEWAEVFGNLYGTGASDTERMLTSGHDVVLVIDVQGARKVRARGVETTTVFVMPSMAVPNSGRVAAAGQRDRDSAAAAGGARRGGGVRRSTISSSSMTS
jgi:guanylate kinase